MTKNINTQNIYTSTDTESRFLTFLPLQGVRLVENSTLYFDIIFRVYRWTHLKPTVTMELMTSVVTKNIKCKIFCRDNNTKPRCKWNLFRFQSKLRFHFLNWIKIWNRTIRWKGFEFWFIFFSHRILKQTPEWSYNIQQERIKELFNKGDVFWPAHSPDQIIPHTL